MMSSHHGLYVQGYTRATMAGTKRRNPARGSITGVAWLSSARVVRCWVKSRNERNPYGVLYHSHRTAERNSEEGGDDVKSAWP